MYLFSLNYLLTALVNVGKFSVSRFMGFSTKANPVKAAKVFTRRSFYRSVIHYPSRQSNNFWFFRVSGGRPGLYLYIARLSATLVKAKCICCTTSATNPEEPNFYTLSHMNENSPPLAIVAD
jgi:hypothetical protein